MENLSEYINIKKHRCTYVMTHFK